jgi:predicted transposase/invertase (TIGR01784 family)
MASEVLMSISKDEAERARLMSEFKYQMDTQSKIGHARREGRQEGREEVARRLKSRGHPLSEIAEDTGLDIAVIREL